MNYRTILIAAVFHFVHQVEKASLKHHKMIQNSVSSKAPAISKQVSRRCINFPHKRTCQILTNQNIKIGCSEKSQKRLPFLHLRWLPRVFTNNPSYLAYVTERDLVTLSLRFGSRNSPLSLPM